MSISPGDARSSARGRASVFVLANALVLVAALAILYTGVPAESFVVLVLVACGINMALIRRVVSSEAGAVAPQRDIEALLRPNRGRQRRAAIRDETTGLSTFWYLEFRLDEEAARSRRYKHSMAVIVMRTGVMEISTFSTDEWQERAALAARRAVAAVRNIDLCAAMAPFEFVFCLVHCDRAGAERAVERLTAELPEYHCEAGIAVFPDDGIEPSVMIEVAQRRMLPVNAQGETQLLGGSEPKETDAA